MKKFALFFTMILLAGCASPNIDLNNQFWQNSNKTIIVASSKSPKATLYQEGPNDISVLWSNDVITHTFRRYLENLTFNSIHALPKNFVKQLQEKNIKAKLYPNQIDIAQLQNTPEFYSGYATKDYRPLAKKLGAHQLLIISAGKVGAARMYYGLIPLETQNAVCILTGKLIDLDTNQLLWRYTAKYFISVKGHWNQPPQYANFRKALNNAITDAKQDLLDDFFNG